jgi:hypothetical protein
MEGGEGAWEGVGGAAAASAAAVSEVAAAASAAAVAASEAAAAASEAAGPQGDGNGWREFNGSARADVRLQSRPGQAGMRLGRLLRHLSTTAWSTRAYFPPQVRNAIEAAIRGVELRHAGEIRFVVETRLDLSPLLADVPARRRALELFGLLRVWDTEQNNGVLLYVLLADRTVEIVADRGIAVRIAQPEWDEVCRCVEMEYREGRFGSGSIAGIERIGQLLARHFPAVGKSANELPDQPLLL